MNRAVNLVGIAFLLIVLCNPDQNCIIRSFLISAPSLICGGSALLLPGGGSAVGFVAQLPLLATVQQWV